jgi:hypothetical protein
MSHTKGMTHAEQRLTLLTSEVLTCFLLCHFQDLDLVKVRTCAVDRVWRAFLPQESDLRASTYATHKGLTFLIYDSDVVLAAELALLNALVLSHLDAKTCQLVCCGIV